MKIPMSWLRKYADIPCDTNKFIEDITKSGTKVENVTEMGGRLSGIVAGKIVSVEKHPDADKLLVCKIDAGTESPIQIVTGAPNVFPGAFVPVALDGAVLADGKTIRRGKLRGVESEGMLCSVEELGFTRHDYPEAPEDGIYIFEENQTPGADAVDLLMIRDDVVEYELTSNRPDCFSVLGIAREAAATYAIPFTPPAVGTPYMASGKNDCSELISVEIMNPELCSRYIARVVKNVKIGPSPLWMRHALTASGVRPINGIVDITNYVMLEYGQPLHAFDISMIEGERIIVRTAKEGEKFTTLDGVERGLDPTMLVIADGKKAVALAGIMGGENSMITEGAGTVLFESANFNGVNVRKTSKKLGLRTESSSKFEKGLDPNLAELAVNRAVSLVGELCCGEAVGGMVDCYPNRRTEKAVEFNPDGINSLLGTDIAAKDMDKMLSRLEIEIKDGKAVIPTFRHDIEGTADLAEEVGRLYGYDNIPATLAAGTPTVGKRSYTQLCEEALKETMVGLGFCEALTYAFESPKTFDRLLVPEGSELRKTVRILNPLGEDFSVMRTTPVNSVMQSLSVNYSRKNGEAKLFELARVYEPRGGEQPTETNVLAMGMYGGGTGFFDIKGVAETVLGEFGITGGAMGAPAVPIPFTHPGRTAEITVNGAPAGFIGEVHPTVLENYGMGEKAYIGVIYMQPLFGDVPKERRFKPLPKFHPVKRDLAVVVGDGITNGEIEAAIRMGKHIESAVLFDIYNGHGVPEGKKSMAYTITLLPEEKTFTDEEIAGIMDEITGNLKRVVGAELRG